MKLKYHHLSAVILSGLILSAFPCNSARAGIAVVVASGELGHINSENPVNGGELIGLGGAAIGAVTGITGIVVGIVTGNFELAEIGGGLLLLDADGSLPADQLQDRFSKQYPFIDNVDAIAGLSGLVKQKYNEVKRPDGSAFIKLNDSEVRPVLIRADLTDAQITKVVNDLN